MTFQAHYFATITARLSLRDPQHCVGCNFPNTRRDWCYVYDEPLDRDGGRLREGALLRCTECIESAIPVEDAEKQSANEIESLKAEAARLRKERDQANAARPALNALLNLIDAATWENVAYHALCRKEDWDEIVAGHSGLVQDKFLAIAERDAARAVLARLERWTHDMGARLIPTAPYPDTYGDGMRRAKYEVETIIAALGKDGQ